MNIKIRKNYEMMCSEVADMVDDGLTSAKRYIVALAAGNTPLGLYAELSNRYRCGHLNAEKMVTVNIEEFLGVESENPGCFRYYMEKNLFRNLKMREASILFPDSLPDDSIEECIRIEKCVSELGGIDLLVVGIGSDGHIGFHSPSLLFRRKTETIKLDDRSRLQYAADFGELDKVPDSGISLGFDILMKAKRVVILASGQGKSGIVKKLTEGDISPSIQASLFTVHPNCTLLIDEEAASEITYR